MDKKIKEYLDSKKGAWSSTTLRSEAARLYALKNLLFLDPSVLYNQLLSANKKPYTIKTIFIRVADFHSYHSNYTYKEFMKKQANLFKGVYTKERIDLTLAEARKRLEQIADTDVRKLAYFILSNGLRSNEALTYKGNGTVLGKGARMRRIFNANGFVLPEGLTYIRLYTELKKVGLKPHTLRKLAATQLAAAGFKEADLMHVMGWSNIQTASWYLQPKADDELASKMKEALSHGVPK